MRRQRRFEHGFGVVDFLISIGAIVFCVLALSEGFRQGRTQMKEVALRKDGDEMSLLFIADLMKTPITGIREMCATAESKTRCSKSAPSEKTNYKEIPIRPGQPLLTRTMGKPLRAYIGPFVDPSLCVEVKSCNELSGSNLLEVVLTYYYFSAISKSVQSKDIAIRRSL